MRVILIFVFLFIMGQNLISKSVTSNDSTIVEVDSLGFYYPVGRISFMLDGKLVPHSKIFKKGKAQYEFAGGTMEILDAIKNYGEKYRNGLLMYKRDERFNFCIEGVVDSKYNGSLVTLFTVTGNVIRSVDSTYVENGCFSFVGPEYLYEKSIISLGNYPDTVLSAELYLERGPIKVKLGHKSVVTSPLSIEYQQFLDSCAEYRRQIKVSLKRKENVEARELELCKYRYRFKKKHIHDGIGRELLLRDAYNIYDPYFEELYEMLSERDKSRGDVKSAYENRKKRLNQQSLAGKQYMDFTLVDSLGIPRKISDYVGKSECLFIDFWASWCGPCRAQEPHLVRLYSQYKDRGFEIVRISLDTDRDRWLSALQNTRGQWTELCIMNKEDNERVRKLYNIAGIPYGLLIDKSGKIVNVITGSWLYLEMLLKSYYKE